MEELVTSVPLKNFSSQLTSSPGFQSSMVFNFALDDKHAEMLKEKGSNHHLNKWYNSMQSAFEADLQELRTTLQQEFQTKLEQEQKHHEESVHQLQELYSKAQVQLTKMKRQMEWKKEAMKLVCDRYVETHQFKLLSYLYFIWKQKYTSHYSTHWKLQLATRYHKQQLQRKVFWRLRNQVVVTWRQAFEKRIRNEAETCIAATSQKYEEKVAELTNQLYHLEKLKREEECKLRHKEEETKKAFLRGLSILNMETMSVLKPSSERKEEHVSEPTPDLFSSSTKTHLEMNPTLSLPLTSLKDTETLYKESIQALSPLYSKFHSSLFSTPIRSSSPSSPSSSIWFPSKDEIQSSSLYQEMQSSNVLSVPQSPFSPSLQKKITLSPPPLPPSSSTTITTSPSLFSNRATLSSPNKEKKTLSVAFKKPNTTPTSTNTNTSTPIPPKLPVYVSSRGKVNNTVFVTRHAPPSIVSEE